MESLDRPVTTGLLVVGRVNYFTDKRYSAVDRPSACGLSHAEVMKCYRGFEGQPWPESMGLEEITLKSGLALLDQYSTVVDYFNRVKEGAICDFLCLYFSVLEHANSPHPDFCFCGYDLGFYVSELNHFSVLFNEVIYGVHGRLRDCARLLNSSLLLPTLEAAETLGEIRDDLVATGADLETDDDGEGFRPIAIYVLKSST